MARATLAYLRERITLGEWPINSRIPREPELMESIGVGKSTLREAVRSLAHLGMLETIRGVGTFVRSRTPISSVLTGYLADYGIAEILAYRRALEIEAARLAASNRTAEQLSELRAAHELDRRAGSAAPKSIERGSTPGAFHHQVFDAAGSSLLAALYTGVMAALRDGTKAGSQVRRIGHDLRLREHKAVLDAIAEGDPWAAARAMAAHVDHDMRTAPPGEPGASPA
jgi:DNA-binding FadR family transcriptional regulator